ncbi:MAG: SMP-30/gluconolactonase/LRE family protein [Pirellula sp.]
MKTTEILHLPSDEAFRFLPEGPYPLGNGRFSWVAIQHGASANHGSLHIFDLNTNQDVTYDLPGRPGFAFPTDRDKFVVGCERSIGVYSPENGSYQVFIDGIDSDCSGTIINDAVTWDGNLIFGTKDLEFRTKKAGLYFWRQRDARLFRLRSDQICSNGKVVRPLDEDHVELLDIDSPTRKVVAYRVNTSSGTIESERTVVDLSQDVGVPDGMTATLDGKSIVVSLYNPTSAPFGRTVQYSVATGLVEETWSTQGSPQATCPQWVIWKDHVWLVITTAIEHMSQERRAESPNAGGLFLAKTEYPCDVAAFEKLVPVFIEPTKL